MIILMIFNYAKDYPNNLSDPKASANHNLLWKKTTHRNCTTTRFQNHKQPKLHHNAFLKPQTAKIAPQQRDIRRVRECNWTIILPKHDNNDSALSKKQGRATWEAAQEALWEVLLEAFWDAVWGHILMTCLVIFCYVWNLEIENVDVPVGTCSKTTRGTLYGTSWACWYGISAFSRFAY